MSHMNRARQFNYGDLVVRRSWRTKVAAFIKDQSLSEQKFDGVFQKFNQYIK